MQESWKVYQLDDSGRYQLVQPRCQQSLLDCPNGFCFGAMARTEKIGQAIGGWWDENGELLLWGWKDPNN